MIVTAPFVTFLILKPTVGIMSSWNPPVATTLTRLVFPAFCSPMSESSISFLKNRLGTQHDLASGLSNSEHVPDNELVSQLDLPSQPVQEPLKESSSHMGFTVNATLNARIDNQGCVLLKTGWQFYQ